MPKSAALSLDPARPVVEQLRERVAAMEVRPARQPVPTLPALEGLLRMQSGGVYGVDSPTLALALAAGASQAGEWVGFAGWSDFGAEAAVGLGVELARTVLVPDPGEHWLEVTAALVDVLRVVVLRPPAQVGAHTAGVIESRLRTRSAALVVWGDWPSCDARLTTEDSRWTGAAGGRGRLGTRWTRLALHAGARPVQRLDVVLAGGTDGLSCVPSDGLQELVTVGQASG